MSPRISEKAFGSRHHVATAVAHVIFVVIICILPEMLMQYAAAGRQHGTPAAPWWFYVKSGVMIAVFYINYFVIVDRTLGGGRHRWLQFVLWNLLLIVAMTALMWYINSIGDIGRRPSRMAQSYRLAASASFFLRDGIMLMLAVMLAMSLRLAGTWLDMEHRQQQLQAQQRELELGSLRNQLNPHFLFNTLNSIYALIEISPREAREAVHELSQLLRYVVYENPEFVDIDSEIRFINNYVELMRLRLGERPVTVSINNRASGPVPVRPLQFVTLVENAFKHGITTNISDPVNISLDVDDHRLIFRTENHVDDNARRCAPGGVGLSNLRRGLELVYGSRASLTIYNDGAIYKATIKIADPCQNADV